jgi:fibronectin type 3 domain-containing protein
MFRKKKFLIWLTLFVAFSFLTGCTRCDGGKSQDKTAPTVPNGISITAVSATEVRVSWKPSADNAAVKGYKIYRNGAFLKSAEETSMTDTGLTPKTKYCYKVSAYDAAGNESAQSTDVCAIL